MGPFQDRGGIGSSWANQAHEAVPELIMAMQDKDKRVRRQTAEALGANW